MLKSQKGITLVALIITIIVMLILAGVSISIVIGEDGVLSKAQSVEPAQIKGALKEAIALANADSMMEYYENPELYLETVIPNGEDSIGEFVTYIKEKISNNFSYINEVGDVFLVTTGEGPFICVNTDGTTGEVNDSTIYTGVILNNADGIVENTYQKIKVDNTMVLISDDIQDIL